MKKFLARLVAIVAILTLTVCGLVACSDSGVEGTYKFKSMTMGDVTIEVGQEMAPGYVLSEDFLVVELKSDNTVVYKVTEGTEVEEMTGTWSVDGDTVSITIENITSTFTHSGSTLTATMNGQTVVLEK